ncbi:MAG: twin-arginine translocation signal domain-containing protein [Chloroflexi bacterium]|nr:twin-arginine translocation signal domain-containing protein [Chloroflexota bacterium]
MMERDRSAPRSRAGALSRRRFLKLAAAAGALAAPGLLGVQGVRSAEGQAPPHISPFAPDGLLEAWPADPAEAAPILVVVNGAGDNPFGLYLTEILRAEGMNCFGAAEVTALHKAPLGWYDLVLLGEGPLTADDAALLEAYVAGGGRLVAMCPDDRLCGVLGVERRTGATVDGYLVADPAHPIAAGMVRRALQFHGRANHYGLAGAQAVAWLAGVDDQPTSLPAVTLAQFGAGWASLWAFDLACSVAYTRQGNPAWSDQERDGADGIRSPDLFTGWIDLHRMETPQADEQQRLLACLVDAMTQNARPIPRLWYFPAGAPGVFIATADSHGNPASAVEHSLRLAEEAGGRMSIYYSPLQGSFSQRLVKTTALRGAELPLVGPAIAGQILGPTRSQVRAWRRRGHEFALHPYVEEGLGPGWECAWREFTGLGYGPVPPTVRTHRILWSGWAETARAQASHGIRMNLDFYHWGPSLRKEDGRWAEGHMIGSGLPMRFVDEAGCLLAIFQQPTQLADDHLLSLHWGGVAQLPTTQALEFSERVLQRCVDEAGCAIAANFHSDPFAVGGPWVAEAEAWMKGTLEAAAGLGLPIWSAEEWLRFTEARSQACFRQVTWAADSGTMRCRLSMETTPGPAVAVMLPTQHAGAHLRQIEVDGVAVQHGTRQLAGTPYGWVAVSQGSHELAVHYA